MSVAKFASSMVFAATFSGLVGVSGAYAQAQPESDTSYLSSLDDMVLDMDLGSIATETYDTVVVAAPTLAEAANSPATVNFAEMGCAELEKWASENTDSTGILAGADIGGEAYQAAMDACSLPTHALALAAPAEAPSS